MSRLPRRDLLCECDVTLEDPTLADGDVGGGGGNGRPARHLALPQFSAPPHRHGGHGCRLRVLRASQ